MATFDISPLFRSTSVGIDRVWDQFHTAMNLDQSGYPAYDILRTSEDEFRISLAVPGFTQAEINVETRDGSLWVSGSRQVDPDHNAYLFRGISTKGFQRTFQLPEHVHVTGAKLADGMLHIELLRELPEALKPKRIEVQAEDAAPQPVLEDASKAA